MCGIAGFAGIGLPAEEATGRLRAMCNAIQHRGPDSDGYFVGEDVAMGMRRLSIIDVAGGSQPICNEDGTVTVVFNGEIYNHHQLRRELMAAGHRFATRSDTEVLVHLYESHGPEMVRHLHGMFAFSIWDSRRQRLFLARDRTGMKPLSYALRGGGIVYCSELRALYAFDRSALRIASGAVMEYLAFGYVPDPDSIFEGVCKLPAGHFLLWSPGRDVHVSRYWSPPLPDPALRDEGELVEELRRRLEAAVVSHLESEVPLGAFLSGGTDSSAVVALMCRHASGRVKTFSIGFAEAAYDESRAARAVANQLGTDHTELRVRPDVEQIFESIAAMFDEPFADSSAIPLHFLSRMTRAQGVTVVLTGDGGDELFGGYETYAAGRMLGAYQRLPRAVRALARGAVARLPVSHGKVTLSEKLRRFMAFSDDPPLVAHALWRALFRPDELSVALADGLSGDVDDRSAAALLLGDPERLADGAIDINTLCYLDTRYYLPADMLVKVDRVTMAHSLEARVPLLDERLVDFAFRLSPRLKWRGRRGKVLMRRALRGAVDDAVLARPKAGFNVPMPGWIAGPLRELFHDVLSPTAVAQAGAFRSTYVERLFREHDARSADHSFRLYALLTYHLWMARWGRAG